MKRLFVPFLALATLFFLGSSAYAQGRGRPPVTPSGAGASSAHGNSASAEGGHGSSDATTSPSSPGTVLSRNPNVGPALTNALTKQGITVTDLKNTCSPFRTLGQCIAALHINHKFPGCTLADLSAAKSLGKAIQGCNPQADAKSEAREAMKQANQEIKDSGS
jgi:hypothetical protein